MLKISFICAVFPPEPEPAGIMARQLAEKLCSDGHSVDMIVPVPNRPAGRIYDGFRGRSRRVESAPSGYQIIRCAHWLVGSQRRLFNRILENITFGISSAWVAWRLGKPDVLIVETWPLFAVQCCALLARWWGIPFIYYVQDVYPEAAEQAGYLQPDSRAADLLRRWDRKLCQDSAKVIVISRTMLNLMSTSRDLSADRMLVIPNWQDAAEFSNDCVREVWRAEQNISPSTFVAMFAGTMGIVSGVDVLVDVADLLREHRDILVLCVGDGVHKERMQEKTRRLGLENIRFLPFQPRERVVEVQRSADVMLLTMTGGSTDTSVPSKLISYLAAGRPVICAADDRATVSRVVTESESGVVVMPGDAEAIASRILGLYHRRSDLERMGQNGRNYFEHHLTLDRAYVQFSELLADVTNRKSATKAS